MSEDKPEIFIDEGWKAQVQREKELAAAKVVDSEPAGNADVEADDDTGLLLSDDDLDSDDASFTALIGSLATQIMYALGLVSDPDSGQVMVNLDAARYTLDLLTMLKEKTEGNLSPEESEMLAESSRELEQVFVVRVQQFQEQALHEAGVDLNNLKGQ